DLCSAGIGGSEALAAGAVAQGSPHLLERPAQVHRRRPGREQHLAGAVERLVAVVLAQRQADAVGRRGTDQRRPAYQHGTNGVRGLVPAAQRHAREGVRQLRLIDDVHRPAVVVQPDGPVGPAVNLHGHILESRPRWDQPARRVRPWPHRLMTARARDYGMGFRRRHRKLAAPRGRKRSMVKTDTILVVNAGSSSIKFSLYPAADGGGPLGGGLVEGIEVAPKFKAQVADQSFEARWP